MTSRLSFSPTADWQFFILSARRSFNWTKIGSGDAAAEQKFSVAASDTVALGAATTVHACLHAHLVPSRNTNHIVATVIIRDNTWKHLGRSWDSCTKRARRVERWPLAVRRGGRIMVFVGEAALPEGAVV